MSVIASPEQDEQLMTLKEIKAVIESLLFTADEPISNAKLQNFFDEDNRPDVASIREAIEALKADYEERALELIEVGGGYRFQVRSKFLPFIKKMIERKPPRYSRALLETLVLIAYRQPMTRGEIEEVRGVTVSTSMMKTLLKRGWVKMVGIKNVPGKPSLYGTTKLFLNYFNLKNLSDLPPLKEWTDLNEEKALQLGLTLEEKSEENELPDDENDTFSDLQEDLEEISETIQ